MKRKHATSAISNAPKEQPPIKKLEFWREPPLSEMLSRNWLILGSIGKIGGKAEDLMRKEKAISEAGFSTYPRIVLAMDFVEAFLKRAGVTEAMTDDEAKAAIEKTQFTKYEKKQILEAVRWLGPVALAVRSSAHGDASGTGIYESVIMGKSDREQICDIKPLFDAIKEVLASHYTENARIFREKLSLPSGIAVIIEPAFVQPMSDDRYGYVSHFESCQFGGIGYTSEMNMDGKKEETIYVSAGLPTKVVGEVGGGVRISPSDFAFVPEGFEDIAGSIWAIEEKNDFFGLDAARLIENERLRDTLRKGYVLAANDTGPYHTEDLDSSSYREPLENLIFGKLRRLEGLLGIPQYIEFGVRELGGKISTACFQIADQKAGSNGKVELYQDGERLVWSNIVVNRGMFDSDTLAVLFSSNGVYDLYNFNKENKNYMLVYNGMVLCSFERGHRNNIGISHVSNASVLAEWIPYASHDNLASHWGGLNEILGKLLMGMSGEHGAYWIDTLNCVSDKNDFMVFKGNFRAVSDGRQAIIYDMRNGKE